MIRAGAGAPGNVSRCLDIFLVCSRYRFLRVELFYLLLSSEASLNIDCVVLPLEGSDKGQC